MEKEIELSARDDSKGAIASRVEMKLRRFTT
jgi:hypothetical protein